MKINKDNKQGQKVEQALREGVLSQSEKINKDVFSKADNMKKKALLKGRFELALEKVEAKLDSNFNCFVEGHNDSNPSMRFNREKGGYHCFGCMDNGQNYDLFDAIKSVYNLTQFKDCYKKAIELFVEGGQAISSKGAGRFTKEMYRVMHFDFHYNIADDKKGLEYLKSRGISKETAIKHGLQTWEYQGYWFVVFINDNGSLVRRRYAKDNKIANMYCSEPSKWWNQRGKSGFFNHRVTEKAKLNSEIVFVTESAIDTLSVEELGFNAIAINSAKNTCEFVIQNDYRYIVGLFDNDEAGIISNSAFKSDGHYSINYEDFNYLSNYKDINEALVEDRESTKEELQKLIEKAKEFYGV